MKSIDGFPDGQGILVNVDGSVCSKKENLQIHHLNYNNIGDEYIGDLEVVCSSCHKKIHKINKQSNYVI